MRYLLIANPISGRGSARSEVDAVLRFFRKRGHDIDLQFTKRTGHAEELARGAANGGYDVIIVGGGDGTINEAINGMAGSSKKLAVIPWGTGNVFATEMRFPKSIAAVCRLILQGDSEHLDLGICGGRRFLLMVGAGVDAYSLKQLQGQGQGLKRRLGVIAYAAAGIRAFAKYRYPAIKVELPDGRVDSGSFVLVSNTSLYGDFFSFTPNASPLDGLLDVFVFRETGRWSTLVLALRYLSRSLVNPDLSVPPLGLQRFRIYRSDRIRLSSAKPTYSQVDGELGSVLPLDISVVPKAVRLIVPKRRLKRYRRTTRID
jgi:diacylglycerol kinase (ATP)